MDDISIVMPFPVRELELIPQNIPLDIVFEDPQLLVVNKPVGLVVHPGYGNYTGTLVNALVYHFSQLPSLPNNYYGRPGLVHRIDSLNSFLGCRSPTRQHVAQFLVCRSCHHVDEIDSVAVQRALMAESRKSGFTLEPSTFEVKGLCGDCASQSSSNR